MAHDTFVSEAQQLRVENEQLKTRITDLESTVHEYNKWKGEFLKQDVVCCICLQGFDEMDNNALTQCKHLYHNRCLKRWCLNHDECPYCRRDIETWWYYPSCVPFYVRFFHGGLW